jgi:hypothetical protein
LRGEPAGKPEYAGQERGREAGKHGRSHRRSVAGVDRRHGHDAGIRAGLLPHGR